MNLRLMTITASLDKKQARILITGSWLDQFGFLPEMLVTVSCQEGVLTMKACGMGLDCYRQVVGEVRQRKQHLLQVFNWTRKKNEAHLVLEGNWLEKQGFRIGDVLLARFEIGLIRIKRLPLPELGFDPQRAAVYKTTKVQAAGNVPMVTLCAEDLRDMGFLAGQSALITYEPDSMILTPFYERKQGRSYGIPKQVNIQARKQASYLGLKGLWLETLGYLPGDFLIAQCSPGLIRIRRLENRRLSF